MRSLIEGWEDLPREKFENRMIEMVKYLSARVSELESWKANVEGNLRKSAIKELRAVRKESV